jgi:uncharacterized protein (DUF58 family)
VNGTHRSAQPCVPVTASQAPVWHRSLGLTAGGLVAIAIATTGLLLSRVDLTLFALPLIAVVLCTRGALPEPEDTTTATVALAETPSGEHRFTATIEPPAGVAMIAIRCTALGSDAQEVVVASAHAELAGHVPALTRSGPHELVRVEYRLLGPDAATFSLPSDPLVAGRVVAPTPVRIQSLPLPTRLHGLTGSHRSARAGDGGDFRDIHPFTSGDRLRRIDWKATARHAQITGELYVRRTDALADATVLIVLDSRDDIYEQITQHDNEPVKTATSSLETAREAATSIAAAYIGAGDRVGFHDLASRRRVIPVGSGGRHLSRLQRVIETTTPASERYRHHRPPIVPPGALVYLLSSLLDEQPINLALHWHARGHRVITVDVLPTADIAQASRYERAAHRIVMMERDDRIRRLRGRGIDLLRWSEDHGLPRHVRLQLLSQPTHASATHVTRQR